MSYILNTNVISPPLNGSSGTAAAQPGTIFSYQNGMWYTILPQNGTNTIPVNNTISGIDIAAPKATGKARDCDGCDCSSCKEFSEFSEPNQSDGTFICYKCRSGW